MRKIAITFAVLAVVCPPFGPAWSQDAASDAAGLDVVAVVAAMQRCWNPPLEDEMRQVVIAVSLDRDGGVTDARVDKARTDEAVSQTAALSAVRAVLQCAPYTMLPPEHFEVWQRLSIRFDASTL